jgi:hypothetical protein
VKDDSEGKEGGAGESLRAETIIRYNTYIQYRIECGTAASHKGGDVMEPSV